MLRVIRRLKAETPLLIKSTFLGAHAVPLEYKGRQTEYVDLIINEMIPMVAAEELADYIDVFCDKGFFTVEDTDRMLNAGMKYGLRAKIHANELDYSGGVQVGVKYNAISVDHLECMGEEEIACLLESETMPTVLPGAAFFLNMIAAGDVRSIVTDKHIWKLACVRMLLIPAATLALFGVLGFHGTAAQVVTLLECCPAAAITSVFAVQFGHDEHFAAGSVVLTTLLSIITLPLCALIITMVM